MSDMGLIAVSFYKRNFTPNPLPLNPSHDPQVDQRPDEVGKAGGAEAVAVDLAGQQHGEVVEVAGLRAALAVEACGQRHRAGHAAQGELALDRRRLQGAGDAGGAEGDQRVARGVEHLGPAHRLGREEHARAGRARVERDGDAAGGEVGEVDPYLGRAHRHGARRLGLPEPVGEAHRGARGVEPVGLGRGGGLRGEEAEGEGERSDHPLGYTRGGGGRMSRLLECPCAGVSAQVPCGGRGIAGAAALKLPAVGVEVMRGGHVPTALDPRRAALARCEDQAEGAVMAARRTFLGGEMQAAHRGEAGGCGQVGDDEGGGAVAQRLFHAPEQILAALRGGEEQAFGAVVGAGEGAGAFGVEAVGAPGGRDPEHRAARGPDEQGGEAVAGGAAGLVQAGLGEGQRAEQAQGRARAVLLAGEERGGHAGECSMFAECSQVGGWGGNGPLRTLEV